MNTKLNILTEQKLYGFIFLLKIKPALALYDTFLNRKTIGGKILEEEIT